MSGPTGTILVVGDPPVTEDVAAALRPDHAVRLADGGEEALELLDGAVDAALVDRRRPGRAGEEVLDRLRERGLDCPVAVVTGVDPDADPAELPVDDRVTAPVTAAEIRAVTDRLLRRADYRERVGELYSLAAERAALAVESEGDLASSPRFESIQERFDRLDDELTEAVRALDPREAFETAIGGAD